MNKNKKRRFAPGQKIPKTYGRAGNISKEESDAMLEEGACPVVLSDTPF